MIDGYSHDIDSTSPEVLGRWMVEIFARIPNPSPATLIQVQAYPSWIPDDSSQGGHGDWIQDSRYLGDLAKITSPRDLVNALSAWLDAYESEVPGE